MAQTKRQIMAELTRRFEAAGLIVTRGPVVVARDAHGNPTLIAENVVTRPAAWQLALPLGETTDGEG